MSSITHIVDDEKVLNEYEYDAWGEVVSQKETVKNRFKFNGQQLDPITQQYYLRARFYNPVIARFTQEDTYRGDGLNLYAYCRNNPTYYVDPTGNMTCPAAVQKMSDRIAEFETIQNPTREQRRQYEKDTSKLASYNRIKDMPDSNWSSSRVSSAARDLLNGETTSVHVRNRSEAEELFLGLYVGEGYTNTTSMDAMTVKSLLGSKGTTYHWDDVLGDDGRVLNHNVTNPDGDKKHLQIHPQTGSVIRIFFE